MYNNLRKRSRRTAHLVICFGSVLKSYSSEIPAPAARYTSLYEAFLQRKGKEREGIRGGRAMGNRWSPHGHEAVDVRHVQMLLLTPRPTMTQGWKEAITILEENTHTVSPTQTENGSFCAKMLRKTVQDFASSIIFSSPHAFPIL